MSHTFPTKKYTWIMLTVPLGGGNERIQRREQ